MNDLTAQEKKIIYHAIKYWQIHKAPFEGKDYKICENLLKHWFSKDQSASS